MNGAELLVSAMEKEGAQQIFGVPGEENLDLVEALRRGVAHQWQARAGDLAEAALEFEMEQHLTVKLRGHPVDEFEIVGRWEAKLQIGDRGIDADGVQRGVVPGELVERLQS